MIDLARWQSTFATTLAQQGPEDALLDLLSPVTGPSSTEGIEVYLGNTRNCRLRALHDIYPVCLRVLGVDCFNAIATSYVQSIPSQHFDLNQEGHEIPLRLARIVRENPAFTALPWLSDLAKFERHCHQVYYLPDDTPPNAGSILTDTDPERLYPVLSRSISWLNTDWPVHLVWEAHQDGADPPSIRVEHRRCAYVIERRNFRAEPIPVTRDLVDLLEACNQQLSVADMADRTDLSVELLGELRARGWLCGLIHAEEQDV